MIYYNLIIFIIYKIQREIFPNGTLKLTFDEYNYKSKQQQNAKQLKLISTFKCLLSDTYGKIASRPAKVFSLIHRDKIGKLN